MAMPGAGPVDDGPWDACEGCGAIIPQVEELPPLCDECWQWTREQEEDD